MQVQILNLKRLHDSIKEEIDTAIADVYDKQNFILGNHVSELEGKIAGSFGVKHAIGVASGTDALLLALKAMAYEIRGKVSFDSEDEILTTPFTFVATGDTIMLSGAKPVFIDIDKTTYNIDVNKVKAYIAKNASKVVGILPVHIYGQSCEMDQIMDIANEYNLKVIEDVAQAYGGLWKEKKLGSIGLAGCLSFFPSKTLGCFGDGGMVLSDDDKIAEIVGMLRKHGGKDKYNVDLLGHNSRLDTLQASILLAKINHIERWNEGRRKVAALYNGNLAGIEDLVLPVEEKGCTHVYHQYTVSTGKRDDLQAYLKNEGVGSMVYYPIALHKQKLFNENSEIAGNLSNAEQATQNVLSLPIDPLQSEEETMYVIDTVKAYFKKAN